MGIANACSQSQLLSDVKGAIQIHCLSRGILPIRKHLRIVVEVKGVTKGQSRGNGHIDKTQYLCHRKYRVILLVKDTTYPIKSTV